MRIGKIEHAERFKAVAAPVRTKLFAEIYQAVFVVVSEDNAFFNALISDGTAVENDGQDGPFVFASAREFEIAFFRQLAVGDKTVSRGFIGSDYRRGGAFFRCDEEAAPVDTEVVPLLREDGLFFAAEAHDVQRVGRFRFGDDLLVGLIDAEFAGGVKINGDVVRFAVRRDDVPRRVSRGAGEDVEIVGKIRVREAKRNFDAGAFKRIRRIGSADGKVRLLHFADCFRELSRIAHKTIRLTVDAYVRSQRVDLSGPVDGKRVRETVGVRPNAEIGILRDKGNARSAKRISRLRNDRLHSAKRRR